MFRRRSSSRYSSSWSSHSSIDTMASIPQSPTKAGSRGRDTGFPEPFCGRGNTTLPHPEANLSPNACISSDDIPITRAMSRHRTFLAKSGWKQRTVHGVLGSTMEQMYSGGGGGGGGGGDAEPATAPGVAPTTAQHRGGADPARPSADSIERPSSSSHGEAPEPIRMSVESDHHRRRHHFLEKVGVYGMK